MTLLLVVAGLAILAALSQAWDDRQRANAKAITDAALSDTEATCRDQHAKQAAYVDGYAPDARSAGRAITPPSEKRQYRESRVRVA